MITKSEQEQVERQARDSQIRYRREVLGETTLEVAERFGLTPQRVQQIAPGRQASDQRSRRDREALRAQMVELAKTEPSFNAIARKLGVSNATVSTYLNSRGIKLTTNNTELYAQGLRKCAVCKQIKPLSEFGPVKSESQGLARKCIPCNRATTRQYYRPRKDTP